MAFAHHVVITGIGIVSPLGTSVSAFWERLIKGPAGIAPLTRFDPSRFSCRLAAEVKDTDLKTVDGPYVHEMGRMDRFVRYALAAADDALTDSGIMAQSPCVPEGSLFIGVGMGGLPHMEAGVMRQEARGPRKITPYLIPSLIPNMAAGMIALNRGLIGPQYTIAGACGSGSQALGQALQAIRSGSLTWALAGGTEGVVTPIAFSGFQAMRALSTTPEPTLTPRPFDQRRNGMIVGEGAAIFVLEERRHAEARGATIYAELRGYATCSGSTQVALQSTTDMTRCMALTLQDAALEMVDIDCIYAQAAGLQKGDECELEALHLISATRKQPVEVTSIKGHIGHTFAASGPLNLVAALEALRHQTISPTLNFEAAERNYAQVEVVRHPRVGDLNHCFINSFGFGGINVSLIVSKYTP